MNSSCHSFGSTEHPSWRDLYLLALFAPDKDKAITLIAEAERALDLRERELLANPQQAGERKAIKAALHSLEMLRSCMGIDRDAIVCT